MRPRTPSILRVCLCCGGLFYVSQSRLRDGHGLYCSRTCSHEKSVKEYHSNWNGGSFVSCGRELIYDPNHPDAHMSGYVFAYRLIAERKIGRRLLPTEIVHHINGNSLDNSPDNLEVMTASEHMRYHSKKILRNRDTSTGRFL